MLSSWCNENWQGKSNYSEKARPSAKLSTPQTHGLLLWGEEMD
jgi:hypothetical protein